MLPRSLISRLATIFRLFRSCRPAHVAGLVVAIVVDAINRAIWRRAPADVGEKGIKRGVPLFANTNPTTAVVQPCFIVRIFTAVFHMAPCPVFRCPTFGVLAGRVAMRSPALGVDVFRQTAAGLRCVIQQVGVFHHSHRPALAAAQCMTLFPANERVRENSPAREALTDVYSGRSGAHSALNFSRTYA